jgi:brefeldin A-inhibited guanine nucleotide-exchange protein
MFSAIIIKCVVQLSLIQTVEWIMLSSTSPEGGKSAGEKEDSGKSIDPAAKRALAKADAFAVPVAQAGEMLKMMNADRLFGLLNCMYSFYARWYLCPFRADAVSFLSCSTQ